MRSSSVPPHASKYSWMNDSMSATDASAVEAAMIPPLSTDMIWPRRRGYFIPRPGDDGVLPGPGDDGSRVESRDEVVPHSRMTISGYAARLQHQLRIKTAEQRPAKGRMPLRGGTPVPGCGQPA